MGDQEFSTDLQEMLMGLMGCDMRAMVQRLYEMLMSMDVDSKLKAAKSERTEERAGYRSQAQQASTTRVSARWGYRERRWEPVAQPAVRQASFKQIRSWGR